MPPLKPVGDGALFEFLAHANRRQAVRGFNRAYLERDAIQMTQLLKPQRLFPAVALFLAIGGCGGETSVQTAPEGSEIERYVAEHPELLNEDSLDAADEAEMAP